MCHVKQLLPQQQESLLRAGVNINAHKMIAKVWDALFSFLTRLAPSCVIYSVCKRFFSDAVFLRMYAKADKAY